MTTGPVALEATGIGLVIDGVRILSDVSFRIAPGEFMALIGPNGAGKTSLINVLSGTQRGTSGRVRLAGRDITGQPMHRRVGSGLGRTFQTSNLLLGRSVAENVRLAVTAEQGVRSALRTVGRRDASTDRVRDLLGQVGLGHVAGRLASDLSHGDRRKLELAMVLGQGASTILLDEPMAGVNTEDVEPLMELIRRVHRDQELSILMVEHHMHVVLGLAERIAVLHHGELLALGTPEDVMADRTVQAAYLGEEL